MVKTLAESGLVKYEPYAGVRLTGPGERLAALVVRRHRLIELFLVNVMGMSWAEVHEEAEHLEHAVSDRLIDRIDEMLGRPAVDPHGDPIPDPEGVVERRPLDSLLSCPLNEPVTISRVTDQEPEFLRFIERRSLKPGAVVEVEERDTAADSVRLRGRDQRTITIGARAASKVLVRAASIVIALLGLGGAAIAQTPAPAARTVEPFQIMDNSFLIEEAYNQEPRIFQNIFGFTRQSGDWQMTFTQEWPAPAMRHQLSYTVAAESVASKSGFGDVFLNYRFQALEEGPGRPAFAPRLSLIVPSGRESAGGGEGGLQANLPLSKQLGDFAFHWNSGLTWLPRGERDDLVSPFLGGSAIYRLRPMLHLMLESLLGFDAADTPLGTVERTRSFTLSPGVRGGWTLAEDTQLILGAAIPITRTGGESSVGIFGYLSYELPYKK
jgi:DtxR family Mn-dependent transcriptional regulator